MKLFEMYDAPKSDAYQDVAKDNSKPKWKQSRKTKLTLKQIRKLRKMNDVRNYERVQNLKKIRKQYTPVPEEGAMPSL
jgi:hypothetical protein